MGGKGWRGEWRETADPHPHIPHMPLLKSGLRGTSIRGHKERTCKKCRTNFIAKTTLHIFCSTSCASEALIMAARQAGIKERNKDC